MRKIVVFSAFLTVLLSSCVVVPVRTTSTSTSTPHTAGNSGKVPPGQAKKATGSKSAKSYAPGQQKKK